MGAVILSDRVAEPFLAGTNSFTHGFTFGGHPVSAAIAMANLDVMENEGVSRTSAPTRASSAAMLDSLRDLPIVGDVRGAGFFHAIELVKDKETKATFDDEESETLLRGFLSGELYRRGLICRADDRGDPVDPAVAAADRGPRAVRGDRVDPARRPDRGRRADAGRWAAAAPRRASLNTADADGP